MMSDDNANITEDKHSESDSNSAVEILVSPTESLPDISHPTPIEIILSGSCEAEEKLVTKCSV